MKYRVAIQAYKNVECPTMPAYFREEVFDDFMAALKFAQQVLGAVLDVSVTISQVR